MLIKNIIQNTFWFFFHFRYNLNVKTKNLYYEIPNFKQEIFKRLVIFALSFMLIFVVSYNINSFLRVWNIINYDKYLEQLYNLKKEKGLNALVDINSSCIACMDCEDLDIHLPILEVKSQDEEDFYLKHDFLKRDNELGSPYQKFGTELNNTTNTVLIGHSAYTDSIFNITKSRSVFGRFNEYLYSNSSFNYNISIETLNGVLNYKVVSIIKFNAKNGTGTDELKVYNTVNLNTQSQFDNFYNIIKSKSLISNLDDASFGDKFITIFTCATDNLDYRVMVIAKQI